MRLIMYKFKMYDIIKRKDGKRFGGIGNYSVTITGTRRDVYHTSTAGALDRLWVEENCWVNTEEPNAIGIKEESKTKPEQLEVFWMVADSEQYPNVSDKVTIQRHKFTDEQKAIRTATMLTQKTGRDYFILKTTKIVKHVYSPVEVIEV